MFARGDDGVQPVANITASRLALKTERKIRIISEDAYVSADFVKRTGTVVRKTANAEQLAEVALTHGMSTFIVAADTADDIRRFGHEVMPDLRERVAAERATR